MSGLVWRLLPPCLLRRAEHYWRFWCALRLEGGSFLGHMQTLLATRCWGIDLGPVWTRLPDGRLIENEQTKARSLSTQALLSRYPWASKVDKEILLFGFRMGEQFARRTAGFHWDTEACAQAAHSTCLLYTSRCV